jgi:uncharacterized protein (TIGR02145 family)
MKKKLGFFLLILLVLIGLTYCVKDETPPIEEKPAVKTTDVEESKDQNKDSTQVNHPPYDSTQVNHPPYRNAITSYVVFISGDEAISGLSVSYERSDSMISRGVCWSTSKNPTINDSKVEDTSPLIKNGSCSVTINGSVIGLSVCSSHCHITGLALKSTYFLRPFVIDNRGIGYGDIQSITTPETIDLIVFNPNLTYGSISDIDGNVYKTIQIGTQIWMAENLKTTRYNDGSQIPNVLDDSEWVALKTGAYRWYENEPATFKNLYGALYNWYTVNTGKLCPTGWHVPGDGEWKQLELALGMTQTEADRWGDGTWFDIRGTDQANKMKATSGWTNWEGANGNGTNESGFSALPGGEIYWYGSSAVFIGFGGAGCITDWWATEEGCGRVVVSAEARIGREVYPALCGVSVRCLKD